MRETHSVAAGLDYVGVSPILADLRDRQAASASKSATDREVIDALSLTLKMEGLVPALESTHAFVQAFKEAPDLSPDDVIIINQSGRGDKDIFTVADAFEDPEVERVHSGQGGGIRCSLRSCKRKRQDNGEILLMTHIVLGYPNFDDCLRVIEVDGRGRRGPDGASDPFSEPIADGPVILHANQQFARRGLRAVDRCLRFAESVTSRFDIPFLFMSYYNILFKYGVEARSRRKWLRLASWARSFRISRRKSRAEYHRRPCNEHRLAHRSTSIRPTPPTNANADFIADLRGRLRVLRGTQGSHGCGYRFLDAASRAISRAAALRRSCRSHSASASKTGATSIFFAVGSTSR